MMHEDLAKTLVVWGFISLLWLIVGGVAALLIDTIHDLWRGRR